MYALRTIYLVRGLVALLWAAAFATVEDSLTAASVLLLIAYPLIDVVAGLLDAREDRGTSARRLQVVSIGLSALTAVALGLGAISGIGAVLVVFGLWAVVAGGLQVSVALRRAAQLGRQWPMLLAGSFSVIAGATYVAAAAGDSPVLTMLVLYTAAGGAFFVLQALSLLWKGHRQTVQA